MKKYLAIFFFFLNLLCTPCLQAQLDPTPLLDEFRGTASITNNGISLIPSFSLGDPAVIFDLKFRKGKLSFEPDLRFSLEAKPWTMIFWFRYQAIEQGRFSLRVGAHPAMNFRTVNVLRNGQAEELIEARRYIAGEIVPNYKLSDKVSVGFYYLHGRGFDDGVKTSNFLVLNANFNQVSLGGDFFFNLTPQVYHLQTDDLTGYYTAGFLTLGKKEFPFSITGMVNKGLRTQILPEEDFTWSLLLNYHF